MKRDHLLGFPSVLLALDEPVSASQRTPSRPLVLRGVQEANRRLDIKVTSALGKTEVAQEKPAKTSSTEFKVGDEVYWVPYKKRFPRGVIRKLFVHPTGVLMAYTDWYNSKGECVAEGSDYDTRQMALASSLKD